MFPTLCKDLNICYASLQNTSLSIKQRNVLAEQGVVANLKSRHDKLLIKQG